MHAGPTAGLGVWHLVLLGLVVFAVHAAAPGGGFHYDDVHAVVDNPHLRSLASVPRFFVDPATFSVDPEHGMYRPVLLTTYAVEYALHGLDARAMLTANRLLHAGNAILVALLAAALTGRAGTAWLAGALFGLHPATTAPAYYVSARSDSLMTFFFLAALVLWLRAEGGDSRWRWGSWAAAALALWTKATAVVLAPALVWLDLGRPQPRPVAWWRHHAPVWTLTALYLAASWGTRFLPRSLALAPRDALSQARTQVEAVLYYLRLWAWPVGGSVEPAFRIADTVTATVAVAALTVLTLLVVAVRLWRRRRPWWLVPAGLALLALLPVLLVPLNVLVNERRAYLPLTFGCLLLAQALAGLHRQPWASRVPGSAGLVLPAAALLLCFGLLSYERGAVWASDLTLWQDAVRRGPAMPRAQLYLGDAHLRVSRHGGRAASHRAAARAAYERVLALQPRQAMLALQARNGLALLDFDAGDLDAAEARLRAVLAVHPDYVDALVNLGNITFVRARAAVVAGRNPGGDLQRAIATYRRALDLAPQRYEARLNLGASYHLAGDLKAAQETYEGAVEMAPGDGVAALNLGLLYRRRAAEAETGAGRSWLERAAVQLRRATRLRPGDPAARRALDEVEANLGAAKQEVRR